MTCKMKAEHFSGSVWDPNAVNQFKGDIIGILVLSRARPNVLGPYDP